MKEGVHTTPGKTTRPRLKFLVNPRFQLRFIAFSGLSALAACTFFYAANCYFFYQYQGFAIDAGFQPSHPSFKILARMEDVMTWIFTVTSLFIIGFTTIAGVFFSNRIAGPLARMKTHFDRVARGETLSNINFRQGDYFDDLATAYNHQLEQLRKRLAQNQAQAQAQSETLSKRSA